MNETDPESETLSRRSVLRTGGAAAGVLAVGGAAASGTVLAGRRGGRGLVEFTNASENEVDLNQPFWVERKGTVDLGASCMSGNSSKQEYYKYDVFYCPSDANPCKMYVHPNEAPVQEGTIYEFHSKKDCKANEMVKVSFGPSNEKC